MALLSRDEAQRLLRVAAFLVDALSISLLLILPASAVSYAPFGDSVFVVGSGVGLALLVPLGRRLAREQPAPGAELVFSVPDSSNSAALGFADAMGRVPFKVSFSSYPDETSELCDLVLLRSSPPGSVVRVQMRTA